MRKSRVLTFLFAFIPGAGHMYLGSMKKGVSIMLAFSLIIAIFAFFNLGLFTIFLPVLWFYAFFDTFNIFGMSPEQRALYEDKFCFGLDVLLEQGVFDIVKKRPRIVGGCLIFLGSWMIFDNLVRPFLWQIRDWAPWFYEILNALPTLLVAAMIILLGLYLMFGGRHKIALPTAKEDDYKEYGEGQK